MNMFFSPSGRKNMLKVGDIHDPPPSAYITDHQGRPRLTDAFKDELRESVHNRHSNHEKNNERREKKKKFGFLGSGGRTKSESSDYSQTFTWMRNAATRYSTPSQGTSIQISSKDDLDGSTQNGLRLFRQGGEEKKSDTPEILTSTTDRGSPCSIDNNQDTPQSTASRQQIKPKILTKKETEDLMRSFHDDREMVIRDSRTGQQRSKTDPPSHAPCDTGQQQKQQTPPSTAKVYVASQSATIESRPSLRKDLADEIQQSVVYRRQSKEIHKKTIVDRIMKRRDSQRELLISDEHGPELPGESQHDDDPNMENTTIKGNVHRRQQQNADGSGSLLLRQENFQAYTQSVSKQKWEKLHSKLPKGKVMKKLDSIQISDETVAKTPPQPSSTTDQSGQRNSLQRKMSRYKKGIQKRPNDTPTLAESGQRNEAFAPFATDGDQPRTTARYLFPGQTNFDFDTPKNSFETDGVDMEIDGDFESYKAEWARLIKTKQSLKAQLNASEMQLSVLQQQVDGLMAQTNDLKLQRDHWQGKATKLKKLHEKERLKFENSTDLIAQARVELTKSINDTRAMRTIIHDLESNLKTKDRRIEELDDTIQFQFEKLDDMASRLVDKESELRVAMGEKRRFEDELAVLIADRDGDDMKETFRQLEQEREQWLWQREQDLEVKRTEIEKENKRILEREKERHRQEMDKIAEEAQVTARLEEEQEKLQEFINQQLQEMKAANNELQERLGKERLESNFELENQEKMIRDLEQDIVDLKKQLAERDLFCRRDSFTQSEMESMKDDLGDSRKQNKLLEKEIERLKKELEGLRVTSNDWREIVLPGHRGITFGDPRSESLIGFLTILVEEHTQEAKKKKEKKKKASKKSTIDMADLQEFAGAKRKTLAAKKKKKKKIATKKTSEKFKPKTETKKIKAKKKSGTTTKKKTVKGKRKAKKTIKSKRKEDGDDISIDNSMTLGQNLELMQSPRGRKGKKGKEDWAFDESSMVPLKRGHNPDLPKKKKTKTKEVFEERRSRTLSPKRIRHKSHYDHAYFGDYDFGGAKQTYDFYRTDRKTKQRSRSQPPRTVFLD